MELNKCQTSLEDIQKKFEETPYGKEGYADLIEFIDTVPFIQAMVRKDRPTIKDLPKDKDGKVIIDLTNPPILDNMDYFRQPAIHYMKTCDRNGEGGKYTDLHPNGNRASEYMKFWNEELRRCREGLVRPDGMWITGYNYWYWNYSPIMKTEAIADKNSDGAVRAERVYKHADPWDHDVYYFHYLEQAQLAGKHAAVLKARGRGYSYKAGSMLARNLMMLKNTVSFAFAATDEYLQGGDGLLTKAWETTDFININTPFRKQFNPNKADWKRSAYFDLDSNAYKGYKSTVKGVIVTKPDATRGKRSKLALFEEAGSFAHLLKAWNIYRSSVEDGSYVFGQAIAFGTGGDAKSSNLEGLEELFYSPKGYRVHYLPNIFDINAKGSVCGFFVPSYMNRKTAATRDQT